MEIPKLAYEEWREIPGYDGWYEVSDLGRVRSWRGHSPRILSLTPNRGGYLRPSLTDSNGRQTKPGVHVLVLETFVSPRPEGLWALHANDDKSDNRLKNLRWGTPGENAEDRARNGKPFRGSSNPHSKLSEVDALEIYARTRLLGEDPRSVAAEYGITRVQAHYIKTGKSWGWLTGAA